MKAFCQGGDRMKIIRTIQEMKAYIKSLQNERKQIGFVATMGYFHEGHLTLMESAKRENDAVIASVFVNPLQFGPNEDFDTYPRDEERDIQLARETGVDALFMPSAEEIYPQRPSITLSITERTDVLCGKSRPGHFDGVLTVLTKLFHIIEPNKVYFGMKDAQQTAVVDALIQDLNFPVELRGIETVREVDGLAKSSRNVYLSEKEREEAVWLYRALEKGRVLVADGETSPVTIINEVKQTITDNTNGKIDYVELYRYPDLKAVSKLNGQVVLAVAVHFNKARLIDNIIFDETGKKLTSFTNR